MTITEISKHSWIQSMKALENKGDIKAQKIMEDYRTMTMSMFWKRYNP